jgi:hypothetical protein
MKRVLLLKILAIVGLFFLYVLLGSSYPLGQYRELIVFCLIFALTLERKQSWLERLTGFLVSGLMVILFMGIEEGIVFGYLLGTH